MSSSLVHAFMVMGSAVLGSPASISSDESLPSVVFPSTDWWSCSSDPPSKVESFGRRWKETAGSRLVGGSSEWEDGFDGEGGARCR